MVVIFTFCMSSGPVKMVFRPAIEVYILYNEFWIFWQFWFKYKNICIYYMCVCVFMCVYVEMWASMCVIRINSIYYYIKLMQYILKKISISYLRNLFIMSYLAVAVQQYCVRSWPPNRSFVHSLLNVFDFTKFRSECVKISRKPRVNVSYSN